MEKDPQSIAPGDRTFVITDSALRNIENMQRRVWDIENKYGDRSIEALKATWSLLHVHATILRWPGKVFAEDDLSLLIQSHITIGVIFHRQKNKKEDGSWEHDPLLGEWSCHS